MAGCSDATHCDRPCPDKGTPCLGVLGIFRLVALGFGGCGGPLFWDFGAAAVGFGGCKLARSIVRHGTRLCNKHGLVTTDLARYMKLLGIM